MQQQNNAPRQRSTERGAMYVTRKPHKHHYSTNRLPTTRRRFVALEEQERSKRKLCVLDLITLLVLFIAIFISIWGGAIMYEKGYNAGYHYAMEVEQR